MLHRETLALQADKNKNGIIEYNEFIEWLQQPMGTVRMGSQGLEYFDLEAMGYFPLGMGFGWLKPIKKHHNHDHCTRWCPLVS